MVDPNCKMSFVLKSELFLKTNPNLCEKAVPFVLLVAVFDGRDLLTNVIDSFSRSVKKE